jgi:hypothetical protein
MNDERFEDYFELFIQKLSALNNTLMKVNDNLEIIANIYSKELIKNLNIVESLREKL